jgi:hypothetical protein
MYDNLDRSFLETSIHNMMEERKIFAIEKTSTRHMLIHIAATTKNRKTTCAYIFYLLITSGI